MVNPNYFGFMKGLAANEDFLTVLNASQEQLEKQRDMEYVARFLVHTNRGYDGKLDVEEFIDEGIIALAAGGPNSEQEKEFNSTFSLLNAAFASNALKRIDYNVPTGRVGLIAFECIAVGIGSNIAEILETNDPVDFVRQRITAFWQSDEIRDFFAKGTRGTTRIQRTIPFGEEWFRP
jgi:hypothetical protein